MRIKDNENVKNFAGDEFMYDLERGITYLYNAIQLWKLVDVEKSQELKRLLKTLSDMEDKDGHILIPPEIAGQIVSNLEGLDKALLRITDKNYHLPGENLKWAMSQSPNMIDSWEEEGKTIHSLGNNLQDVRLARQLLRNAVRLGKYVVIEK